MKKKIGINRFRILALAFSLILFAAGIAVTLGIFLPITGLVSPNNPLFRMGLQVFSVYRFSAFLIPILFLYGAVLLLIPGWTRESKAVLLGAPLYFVTAIIAERLITIFSPAIALSIVRHFVVISIVICALLLVCFEIFLMLMLAEKFAGHRFVLRSAADETIDSDNGEEDDDEWYDSESDEAVDVSQESAEPVPVKTEDATETARPVVNAQSLSPSDKTSNSSVAAAGTANVPAHDIKPAALDDSAAIAMPKNTDIDKKLRPIDQTDKKTVEIAVREDATLVYDAEFRTLGDVTVSDKLTVSAPFAAQSQISGAESNVSNDFAAAAASVDIEPELLNPIDDEEPLPLSTPLAAVIGEKLPEYANASHIVHKESLSVAGTAASDFTDEAGAADTAVHSMNEAVVGGSADLPDETADRDVSHDGDTTITTGGRVADATVSETETESAPVFDPADPDNLFSSLEEITEPIERIKRGEYVRRQCEDTVSAVPIKHEAASEVPDEGSATPYEEETAVPHEETSAAEQGQDSLDSSVADAPQPAGLPAEADTIVPVVSASFAPSDNEAVYGESAHNTLDADEPLSENSAADDLYEDEEPADENWEPVMPLVFTNGVPIPNETSDLLDTLVVIDSEQSESVQSKEESALEKDSAVNKTSGYGSSSAVEQECKTDDAEAASVDQPASADERFDGTAECEAAECEPPAAGNIDSEYAAESKTDDDTAADESFEPGDEAEASAAFESVAQSQSETSSSTSDIPEAALTAAVPPEASGTTQEESVLLNALDQTPAIVPCKPAPPPPPRKKYAIPFDLLTDYPDGEYWVVDDATRRSALMLKSTFNEFKIDVSITGIRKGPVVTMFEMLPSPGIKLSKITNLQDNIALRLAASSVRIVAPIPGKHAVGIEVPNKKRSIVSFRELIETDLPEAAKMAIPIVIGKDVTGNPQLLDLASTPHLLIAGATGSGKSVCVNSIILSILYNRRPDEVKLIMVDPKIVELKLYNDIAHLLTPVITEPKRAFQALQYALCEMERRYALLDNMGVRDIKTFNAKIKAERIATEALPYIVIIIDEFADLMATSGKELEATVARLCAMSRAVGIHLVLATQRPSIDVITGLIKANIPSRIAFMVASKTDSRIILDEMGAEKLLGKGDMLYVSAAQPFPTRMQGAFVSEQEVERVVACVKEYCEPEYIDDEIFVDDDDESFDTAVFSDENDPLYDQALEIVTFAGKASASYVQRKLKIGYNRAARLIEEMEARGIVGPANGSKPREILRRS